MENRIYRGRLERWNDGRGFGFIRPENANKDIFIHILALQKMSRRPVIGDVITYQIHTDNKGKNKAVNATIEGVTPVEPRVTGRGRKRKSISKYISNLILILILISIVIFFYLEIEKNNYISRFLETISSSKMSNKKYNTNFSCKGKIYCSQMTSCEEATFYQRNCPGTKMDGDGDGVPCERQWCGW